MGWLGDSEGTDALIRGLVVVGNQSLNPMRRKEEARYSDGIQQLITKAGYTPALTYSTTVAFILSTREAVIN